MGRRAALKKPANRTETFTKPNSLVGVQPRHIAPSPAEFESHGATEESGAFLLMMTFRSLA